MEIISKNSRKLKFRLQGLQQQREHSRFKRHFNGVNLLPIVLSPGHEVRFLHQPLIDIFYNFEHP